jgi:signal transduction histidine kinase
VALTMGFPPEGQTWERVLVTLMDISPRKLVEREREARVLEMERAVRFSEMFVGILGHDLRNPLSAILAAANLIEMLPGSEKVLKPAQRIATSAARMERMISQLLDFTRIRLGRGLPLRRSAVDLADLCRSIIEELEPVHNREIRFEPKGDVVGSWDRDRLSQLVSNLAANACQHGTADHPVTLELDGRDPEIVRIRIQNHGAIPGPLLPLIFEPLRAPSERERRDGSSGLGLGLYITQQIALAHAGAISVESDTARGTCFTVELPRHPPGDRETPPLLTERIFPVATDAR